MTVNELMALRALLGQFLGYLSILIPEHVENELVVSTNTTYAFVSSIIEKETNLQGDALPPPD